MIQIQGIPLKVMWKNLILAGSSQGGKERDRKRRMHEKSFKRRKLGSDLSVLHKNKMLLLSAFFFFVSDLVKKFWSRNRSDESLPWIRLWTTTSITSHFAFTYKIHYAHVSVYYIDDYKPFDKSVF